MATCTDRSESFFCLILTNAIGFWYTIPVENLVDQERKYHAF